MDRQSRGPRPDAGLIDAGDRRVDTFVRGLLSGALVGAVIAGSAIWERRHPGGAAPTAGPGSASPAPATAEGSPVAPAEPGAPPG